MADRITVIAAIGNHDESTGGAKDAVSAALVLPEKDGILNVGIPESRKDAML